MSVKRVLVVEDDIHLSAAIYRALRQSFGAVDLTWVSTEEDAELELAHGRFDAVISDYLLASAGDGVDLWRHCVHLYPTLPFILVSAVPFEEILARFKAGEPEPPLLPKPFRVSEIIEFFEEAA